MKNIEKQPFWDNLKPAFKKDIYDFFQKHELIKFWNRIHWFALIISLFTITYFIMNLSSNDFKIESLLAACLPFIFVVIIEKVMANPRKAFTKAKQSIKDKMIIKVCTCHSYCTCKEDFNAFMVKNKFNILKS